MPEISERSMRDLIRELRATSDRLKGELKTVEYDIAVLNRAIAIFEKPEPTKRMRRQTYMNVSPDELRGKGVEEAAVTIAEQNNGLLVSTPARELLIEAGVLTVKQSNYMLWETLKGSNRFEPTGQRGRWKLREPIPTLKVV